MKSDVKGNSQIQTKKMAGGRKETKVYEKLKNTVSISPSNVYGHNNR